MIESTFNWLFGSEFEDRFLLVVTRLINLDPDLIEKFERYQEYNKIDHI